MEHINSSTSNPEEDDGTRKEWLVNVYLSADEDIRKYINNYFDTEDKNTKDELFKKIKRTSMKVLRSGRQKKRTEYGITPCLIHQQTGVMATPFFRETPCHYWQGPRQTDTSTEANERREARNRQRKQVGHFLFCSTVHETSIPKILLIYNR